MFLGLTQLKQQVAKFSINRGFMYVQESCPETFFKDI